MILSRDEEQQMNQIRKIVDEQKMVVNEVEARREARLKRLHGRARVNELIYTKEGVFEIDAYRHPILQDLLRNESGEVVKPRKPSQKKRKKKRQIYVEKVQLACMIEGIHNPRLPMLLEGVRPA